MTEKKIEVEKGEKEKIEGERRKSCSSVKVGKRSKQRRQGENG